MSDDESILWKKLENSRQVPLEPLWLENVYSPNLTFDLRKALSEKMGLLADRGWPVIKCLLQRYGDLPDLVVAAGLCHQIEAREWLLELLPRSDDDENIQCLLFNPSVVGVLKYQQQSSQNAYTTLVKHNDSQDSN